MHTKLHTKLHTKTHTIKSNIKKSRAAHGSPASLCNYIYFFGAVYVRAFALSDTPEVVGSITAFHTLASTENTTYGLSTAALRVEKKIPHDVTSEPVIP